jgi:endoglucanase
MITLSKIRLHSITFTTITSVCILLLTACGGSSAPKNDSTGTYKFSITPESSAPASSKVASSKPASSVAPDTSGVTMLHTQGTQWRKANDRQINLRGTNLGNWLSLEMWMMGQGSNDVIDQCTLEATLDSRFTLAERERLMTKFRDNWITTRDWDLLQSFKFNVVRIPFNWNLIEDEKKPSTLRTDAWKYLDAAVMEAEKRGMYVILDLHGAVGGQAKKDEAHDGCKGESLYFTTPENITRTTWLWEQIATHFKDNPAVAAYGLLNEPWATDATNLAKVVSDLYTAIRKVDANHIIILPGHESGITAYGKPADKGMTNVVFDMHFYPGIFDGGKPSYNVHRDWLTCGADGTKGVCELDKLITGLNTPLLIGEFQPWQELGELGGKITRATYDRYSAYGWGATSWAYKVIKNTGGQDKGSWGLVTNEKNLGVMAKANTWACAGWNSSFDNACDLKTPSFTVPGTGNKTYYLLIKAGSTGDGKLDISFDKISIKESGAATELVKNGDFGSADNWTLWNAATSKQDVDFNHAAVDKTPIGSEGAYLRLSGMQDVFVNAGIYQAVTLVGGKTYTFSGTFKDNTSKNSWGELYLVEAKPVEGQDINGDSVPKVDFKTASLADIEALFASFGNIGYDVHAGVKSEMTNPTPSNIFVLPAKPTGLKITEATGSVTLNWDANSETDLTGYRVYRSTSTGTEGTKLATLTAATYVDTTVVDGVTYFYTVAATDADDESYRSSEVATKTSQIPIPAKIEAENFSEQKGTQNEDCADVGGGIDVGHFDDGDYLEFKIKAVTAGDFMVDYRLASKGGSTGFELLIDGVKVDTRVVADTGDWQKWATFTSPKIAITAGPHTLRFAAKGGGWNLNWFEVKAAN